MAFKKYLGGHKRRNMEEFWRDQNKWNEQKAKKIQELSREREKDECKTFRPSIDKNSIILASQDKNHMMNVPVHKRLHDLSKGKCRNHVKSALSMNYNKPQTNNMSSKQFYMTESFKIKDVLDQKSRRCRSKELKRKNLHNKLYDDAFKLKATQSKISNQISKHQSVRSFIKHTSKPSQIANPVSHRSPNPSFHHPHKIHKCASSYIKPVIKPCVKSEKIAEEFRKKMEKKLNLKHMDVVDWLHLSGHNKEEWLKQQRDLANKQSFKECTFKPNINKKGYKKPKFQISPNDVFSELYQRAKKQREKRSQGRAIEEIEFEKQKDECTFIPRINKNKLTGSGSKKCVDIRKSSHQGSNPEVTYTYTYRHPEIEVEDSPEQYMISQKSIGEINRSKYLDQENLGNLIP